MFYYFKLALFIVGTKLCDSQAFQYSPYIKYNVTSFDLCSVNSTVYKFSPITGISLLECVSRCALLDNCTGLVYRRLSLLCQRFSEQVNMQMTIDDCIFITRSDIYVAPEFQEIQLCSHEGACLTPECDYPDIANGQPIGNIFYVDSTQTVQCNSGYYIYGTETITCLSNKTWSPLPECYKECNTVFDNADVDLHVEQIPARATVRCHEGFVSTGTTSKTYNITEENLICDKTGTWNPDIVCTNYLNIFSAAFMKPASQSSTYRYGANLATDGRWISVAGKLSCSHTALENEETPWWEVDLLQTYSIRRVIILNRGSAYYAKKLYNVTITVGQTTNPANFCAFYPGQSPPETMIVLYCEDTIEGRYVRLSKPYGQYNHDSLSLCEVALYDD